MIRGMMNSLLPALNRKLRLLNRTLPAGLRPIYANVFGQSKMIMALIKGHYLNFYQLDLQEGEDRAYVGYLGMGPNLAFITNMIVGDQIPLLQRQFRVPWWRIKYAVNQAKAISDALIVDLPHQFLRHLNFNDGILSPFLLRSYIKTNCSWAEIEQRFHANIRQAIRKIGMIKCVISHQDDDLLFFYHHIYHPYISERFGVLADPSSLEELRYYFKRGALLVCKDDHDQIVGGYLYYMMNKIMYYHVGATKPGLCKNIFSITNATGIFEMIRHAWQHGCSILDLGLSRPFLNDGVARYKYYWGACAKIDPSYTWGLWFGLMRKSAVVQSLLSRFPWIWYDASGSLHGLIVSSGSPPADDQSLSRLAHSWWVPGLKDVIVYPNNTSSAFPSAVYNPFPVLGPAKVLKLQSNS